MIWCVRKKYKCPHSQYLWDLYPSDYVLFPKIKKCLVEEWYGSNDDIIAQTNANFEDFHKFDDLDEIENLKKPRITFF